MSGSNAGAIIVTGAAGALGAGLARYWLGRGRPVTLVDRPQSEATLRATERQFPELALAVMADITEEKAWPRIVEQTERERGQLVGAVLAAGGFQGGAPFHASNEAVWDQMMARNLLTAKASLRGVIAKMVEQGTGSVVLVGARPGIRPWDGAKMAEYTASKAAVIALSQAVAAEVREAGVRVNVVMPSTIDTPANRQSMPKAEFERWVSIESLCGVIAFLLSDAARDVSGAALPVFGRS